LFDGKDISEKEMEVFEKKFKALDDKIGITEINKKLDKIQSSNEFMKVQDFYEITEKQEKIIQEIENEIREVEKRNENLYDSLYNRIDKKVEQLMKLDQEGVDKDNSKEVKKVFKDLEELEKERQKIDKKTGINKLYDKLESTWNNFGNKNK
jgi:chemotaxis protein histidine kinase CheA